MSGVLSATTLRVTFSDDDASDENIDRLIEATEDEIAMAMDAVRVHLTEKFAALGLTFEVVE